MAPANPDVLISGASVAGPVLAHWLRRYDFNPTVVERSPSVRTGLGGHAVDLFGPSVDVIERMGVLPEILEARTRTELILFERDGKPPVALNMGQVAAGMSIRHIEILRGELTKILSGAVSDGVEYLFGDSIRALDDHGDGVDVTFETSRPRRFDLVVGADGLHSNVRRLMFGDEARFMRYIGGYFAVFTLPNYLDLDGRMVVYNRPGRVVGMYPVHQSREARAVFLFRRVEPLVYDHRDRGKQKKLLREAFADFGWEAPRLLAELDDAEDLYFDSISQIIMDTWSRGRVTLVGDAGYSPGPAVGGGTTIAVIGAYVLAGELYRAGGEPAVALRAYEDKMREFVRLNRKLGTTNVKRLIPATPTRVRLLQEAMRWLPKLPVPVQRLAAASRAGAFESFALADYEVGPPKLRP